MTTSEVTYHAPQAPVKMETPLGAMMEYYLKMEPHLFKSTVEEQLQRIRDERDTEAAARLQQKQDQGSQPATDGRDLVLYR